MMCSGTFFCICNFAPYNGCIKWKNMEKRCKRYGIDIRIALCETEDSD